MNKAFLKKILKIILIDFFVYGILYFPIWWYSRGLYKALLRCFRIFYDSFENTGLSMQIRYLFKPMYGQRDVAGILISFFMRLIIVIFKLICVMFVFILCSFLFILWIILPFVVIYGIIVNYNFLTQK